MRYEGHHTDRFSAEGIKAVEQNLLNVSERESDARLWVNTIWITIYIKGIKLLRIKIYS